MAARYTRVYVEAVAVTPNKRVNPAVRASRRLQQRQAARPRWPAGYAQR